MCGIAGYLSPSPIQDERLAESMAGAIRYRGLDASGQWGVQGSIRMFHSRLKIIDLDGGAQPMHDVESRRVIVFNGEIYNYQELRKQYEREGGKFRTASDTEVLLVGYGLKGQAVLGDLIGMFAFAIWDDKKNELFLARDRLGKKPLYWFESTAGFFFSSTIDAFSSCPGWRSELSRECLDFYSAVGSFPGHLTAFRQARSLPPGSFARVKRGEPPEIRRYWSMNFAQKRRMSMDAAIEEYEAILTDAIRVRLRADVPVALTFSGGVDSGTIAGITTKRLGQSLRCFTLDYDAVDDRSEEVVTAREVASMMGLEWTYLNFDYENQLLSALDEAMHVVDQPCNHIAIAYSKRLYEAIKPHATVVLTGNGADELFLGYDGNEALLERDAKRRGGWWDVIRRVFQGRSRSRFEMANYQCSYVKANLGRYDLDVAPEEIVATLHAEIEEAGVETYADLYSFMALSYYTCDANFRLPDISGMNAQVEVRSPFLDHRMVEFSASLPGSLKIGTSSDASLNKLLPKRYYQRFVPHRIAWASKKGMGFNLRYGESFATNAEFQQAFEESVTAIESIGLGAERLRSAWRDFVRDKRSGVRYPPAAGKVMGGFMLGRWLRTGRYRVQSFQESA